MSDSESDLGELNMCENGACDTRDIKILQLEQRLRLYEVDADREMCHRRKRFLESATRVNSMLPLLSMMLHSTEAFDPFQFKTVIDCINLVIEVLTAVGVTEFKTEAVACGVENHPDVADAGRNIDRFAGAIKAEISKLKNFSIQLIRDDVLKQ